MEDTAVDTGDEKAVKAKKKKWQLKREQELEDIKKLIATSEGRYLIWRLLEKCKLFDSISGSSDKEMNRLSGGRDIGLWMLSEVEAAVPDAYLDLVKESRVRDNG